MKIDDPILTAYALGEPLPPEERAAVEKLLAESEEAREYVEETRVFAGMLAGEFRAELQEPLEATAARKTLKVVPLPTPRRSWGRWVIGGLSTAAAAVVIIGIMLPAFTQVIEKQSPAQLEASRARYQARRNQAPPEIPSLSADAAKIAGEAEEAVRSLERKMGDQDFTVAESGFRDTLGSFPATPPAPVAPVSGKSALASPSDRVIGQFTHGRSSTGAGGPPLSAKVGMDGRFLNRGELREHGLPDPYDLGERYPSFSENSFFETVREPLSTFSLDVDTASYANVRRMIRQGSLPPAGAVRLEEMVNYFEYADPAPKGREPLAVHVESAEAPWKPEHRLVRIGVRARDVDRAELKGVNLVFLIDTSGSMSTENKLPLVKESLRLLLDQLGEDDRVAIVTYAGESRLALKSTPVSERAKIAEAIDALKARGSTNGAGGLEAAYEIARAGFIKGGVNRVILATDGDFNVGLTRDADLEKYIADEAGSGVYLTVLGFGIGNTNDRTMKLLSTKGNGNYAYIDTLGEARKVLAEQMRGTLVTVAKDVKLQVEFNPAKVQSYRLLGYENRLMAKEDFNDDRKDAGEVGAGHQVTALYEVVPAGLPPKVDALKYQPAQPKENEARTPTAKSDEWLTVKLRYKQPESDTSERMEIPFTDRGIALEESSEDLRFAAAVAQYSLLLSRSAHAEGAEWSRTLELAEGALGSDPHGYRAEFLQLVMKARALEAHGGWKH